MMAADLWMSQDYSWRRIVEAGVADRVCPIRSEAHALPFGNVRADTQPDGWRHWRDFERALVVAGKNRFPSDLETLERDQGRYLGFIRVVATRTEASGMNLYDPSLGTRVGVDS